MAEEKAESAETSNIDLKEKIGVELSRGSIAAAEYTATSLGIRRRGDVMEQWLRWAWDCVDPNTGLLPEINPVSGRSRDDILATVQSPNARKKAGR